MISNAITHGKKAGLVMLELYYSKGKIILSVSDDGVGIAPEHIEKIFTRFFQINPDRSKQLTGHSGLGLPMVKMIAEMHGGDVKVHSTPGVGSTFIVSFPSTLPKRIEKGDEIDNSESRKHFQWLRKNPDSKK